MSSSHELFLDECRSGYKKRVRPFIAKDKQEIYLERLKYEVGVIQKLGFEDYFLIVSDIVRYAEENSVRVGPGRGSAAGSLVSYCLGITKLDPIKYGLYFERFLNKDRVSAPDIDVDFSSKGRQKVIDYIRSKYGEDRACSIISYSRMKVKGLIRDVAKVLGIDPIHIDKMSKLIDYTSESVKELLDGGGEILEWQVKYPEVFDIAIELNGCIKNAGKHAAGVLITKNTLLESLPVMVANNGVLITQYDKDALEDLNFLKMDILGLGTLDIISEAMEMIGKDVLLEHELDLQDSKVMSEFCKGNTTGVFTFETYGMKKTLKSVQPESIKDLSAVNALYRPGAMSGIEHFLNGKESKTIYYFEDEKLKPILAETYGTIVYQEQVMAMFQAVAGFSASKADLVRKAVGKKKHEEITKMKKEFVDGCLETGHTQEWAVNLFNVIEKSTTYSFNRSHAMSYALLGYQCMFLKCYYPVQFMTRLLANHMDNGWDATLGEFDKKSKLKEYEKEAKRLGIKIVDFNVNTSRAEYRCNVDKKVIYRGLSAIKNVGAAAEEIEKLKPFTSFEDFYKRVSKSKVRSNAMVALIDCGAFDSIESNRDRIRGYVGAPIKGKERVKEKEISLFEE